MGSEAVHYFPEHLRPVYGEVDELIMRDASVHLESLGDGCFMLIVENAERHVHLQIHYQKGRKVWAHVYEEYSGEEWQRLQAEWAADTGA